MKQKHKTWRDNLTADQKRHTTEHGIRTKTEFESMRRGQVMMMDSVPGGNEPCWMCRQIARAVGIESQGFSGAKPAMR